MMYGHTNPTMNCSHPRREKRQRALVLLLFLLLSLSAAASAMSASAAEAGKPKLKLKTTSLTLVSGTTCKLKLTKTNITEKVVWKSSKPKVATVNSKGKITAKKSGTTKITAKANGCKVTCRVKVISAKLSASKLTLDKGKTKKLKVSGTTQKITWSSSDKSIAAVNSKGKVTAKKKGTAKITAMIGDSKLSCDVTVTTTKWDDLLDKYQKKSSVKQLLFVKYTGGTKADVELWSKTGQAWEKILSCDGEVGRYGIDKQREGDKKTPTGTFNLTSGFGIKKNPGAKMSYVRVNSSLYWCGDSHYYNQLVDITEKPHNCTGEHLIDYTQCYAYGMFLDYNKNCVPGKGSAIFLHCKGNSGYTAGCVAVSQENMIKILQNTEKGAKICIYKK